MHVVLVVPEPIFRERLVSQFSRPRGINLADIYNGGDGGVDVEPDALDGRRDLVSPELVGSSSCGGRFVAWSRHLSSQVFLPFEVLIVSI